MTSDHDESRQLMARTLLDWSVAMEAGTLTDPAVTDAGERVGVRLAGCAAIGTKVKPRGLSIETTYAKGDVVATDQRLIVLDRTGSPELEWRWDDDLGQGVPQKDWWGVLWLPSETRHAAGTRHLLGVVTQSVLGWRKPNRDQLAAMVPAWLQLLGVQALAQGRLGEWQSEVRRPGTSERDA